KRSQQRATRGRFQNAEFLQAVDLILGSLHAVELTRFGAECHARVVRVAGGAIGPAWVSPILSSLRRADVEPCRTPCVGQDHRAALILTPLIAVTDPVTLVELHE